MYFDITDDKNNYVDAAKNGNKTAVMISYFNDDNYPDLRTLNLDFEGRVENYDIFLLDSEHDAESVGCVKSGACIDIKPSTALLLK